MNLDLFYKVDPEWEWYIGEIYHKLIAGNCNNYNTVVEFAPGYRYKIGYALSKDNFSGTLYLIDSNSNVVDYVVDKYKTLLPNATIIGINKNLTDSIPMLPDKIDLFLSNHSIDDMIISEYLDEATQKEVFNNEELSKELLLEKWENLSADKEILETIKSKVFNEFALFFTKIAVDLIIMSQYKSNEYFVNNGNFADDTTRDLFLKLKNCITTNDDFVNSLLAFYAKEDDERFKDIGFLKNTQNALNWIVGKYKP